MSVPRVSVVIPTFNRYGFVREAIDSVFAQTMSAFECIVVDDGSTDGTAEVLESIDDPRLTVIRQERRGVSAARNRGAAASRAPLVAFLDSDDRWLPEKLAVQCRFFDAHPQIALCQTEELWYRNGVRVNPRRKHAKPSGWIFRCCLPLCVVSPSAAMIRRAFFDALGGFDEALPACEDYDLWLRAVLRTEVATLPEALTIKRGGHADQLSRGWGLDRWRIRALQKILDDPLLPAEDRPLVEAEIVRRSRIVAAGARKRGNEELARALDQ